MRRNGGNELNKIKYNLWFSIIMLVFISLLTAANLFAWFANSKASRMDDFNLYTIGYDFDVSLSMDKGETWSDYTAGGMVLGFEDIFSGSANQKTLMINCKNKTTKDLSFFWFLRAPANQDEVVYTDGQNNHYYFGSQMRVSDITATTSEGEARNISTQAIGKGSFLVTTSPQGQGQVTSVPSQVASIPQIDLIDDLQIDAGQTLVLTLTFTFVDNGENQNVYQAPFLGKCSRTLAVMVKGTD